MSRNGSGVMGVINAFVPGTVITASDFNENFDDIANELTNSLALDGQSTMTGALKLANGTVSAPACAFGADADSGLYRIGGNNIGVGVGGTKIIDIASTGITVTGELSGDTIKLGGGDVWSTGDVKLTFKTAADTGWLLFNDGTLGDGSSGASHANADAEDLFTLIFSNLTDANSPILTSAGAATTRAAQTNAATAWAAHCRISLSKALGRALGIAGAGSGLTSRALGVAVGAETKPIGQTNLPAVAPTFTGAQIDAVIVPLHDGAGHNVDTITNNSSADGGLFGIIPTSAVGTNVYRAATSAGNGGVTIPAMTPAGTISNLGSGTALDVMNPMTFLNAMIKL